MKPINKMSALELIQEFEAIVQEEEMTGISMGDRIRKEELRDELSIRGYFFAY